MPGTMSIGGIASGMKTDDIIAKFMEIARKPQTRLKETITKDQKKLTAWQDLNTRVFALQANSNSIASTSAFTSKTATSSLTDVVAVKASADATAGTYYINVNNSAKSHQIASQSFAGVDTSVAAGTIMINVDSSPVNITIDSTNNTLMGVKDAINKSGAGVQASIVNQGTVSSPSYSLIISSKNTGTDHKMIVDAGATGLQINTDQNGEGDRVLVQDAVDAELKMGNLTFKRSSNTVSDIIPGVTLDIANPDSTKTVKIEVTQDNSAVKTAIKTFVDTYNGIQSTINDLTSYDAEAGTSGLLLGDYDLQTLQMDLQTAVTQTVVGIPWVKDKTTYNAISAIGISTGSDGLLSINDSDLSAALESNSADVAKLFGTSLDSDSAYVSYVSSTSETQPSTNKGYDIAITQAATRLQITSGQAFTGPLDADETLTINGKSVFLKSGWDLSQMLDEINKQSSNTNVGAFESIVDGKSYLSLRSMQYGSGRDFTAFSSLANTTTANTSGLGMTTVSKDAYLGENNVGTKVDGLDVAGTINGEECTGTGQVLTANSTSTTSSIKGLQIIATNTEPLETNARFIKGVGSSIKELLTKMTSTSGVFALKTKSINEDITAVTKDIADLETSALAKQDQLYTQFNNMESQMATLQNQGDSLSAQLAALNS